MHAGQGSMEGFCSLFLGHFRAISVQFLTISVPITGDFLVFSGRFMNSCIEIHGRPENDSEMNQKCTGNQAWNRHRRRLAFCRRKTGGF